ncbi:MAG: 3-deoxy-manno-octulosonate cytidylyltransferase [Desulfobulbaceae bacterium]|nr:3-deoxy-manno-octulosonate cytidylyltransferase [Desulfobulbaceae bacterium]
MKIVVGIPSRMGSSRFPGKPLCDILGRPMLEHVYRRCALANSVDEVFVATCNVEIEKFCESIGARAIMTDPAISRPGLRVAEACKVLDLADDDIVVVVQGDEPLVRPEMIELAVQPLLEDDDVYCVNLTADMTEQEWLDPNEIKVVCDLNMNAIYMSRSPIPSRVHPEKPVIGPRLRQVCIMPFRKKDLLAFNSLSPTPLEEAESIEMLRAIEHGYKVRMVKTSFVSKSVDNEEDRRVVERLMQNDEIYRQHGF